MPRLNILERTRRPLLVCDRPYEDLSLNLFNIIREGPEWRMWYLSYDHTYRDDRDSYLCYARSADGEHWEKPLLGLIEFAGSQENNLLAVGARMGGLCGHHVFIDPHAEPEQRYKILFARLVGTKWMLFGGFSADGLRWAFLPEPLGRFNTDTQVVCLPDAHGYGLFVRMWNGPGDYQGRRTVGHTRSDHFGDFPAPVEVLAPDDQDPPNLHFYNSAATRLGEDLYVMFPSAFYAGADLVIPHAAVSHDGVHFTRVGREPFLPLGQSGGFDTTSIYVVPGAFPGPRPGTWWLYYFGDNVGHDQNLPAKVHNSGGFGRFLLGVD